VLRAFTDDNVPGDTDPLGDLGVPELELVLAHGFTFESQLDKRRKSARADKALEPEAKAELDSGTPIYRSSPSNAAVFARSPCRPTFRRGPTRGDQVLRAGDEVVERIGFVGQTAPLVPGAAQLADPADVGDRVGTHGSSRLSRAADRVGSMLISWRSRAVKAWGHFPTEQAAVKCVYMAIMSLDPTGKGRQRWSNRWKPALNAFTVAFPGRIINQAK
jgi:hypothetical protein